MKPTLALFAPLLAAAAFAAAQGAEDPFQSLEDMTLPASQAFYAEQSARARAALDAIPGRAALLDRIRALSESSPLVTRFELTNGGRVFYLKRSPGQATASLWVRDKLTAAERLLVDPARFSRGGPTAIDWFVPSPDGRHVAYGVSAGGSEDSVLRVIAVDGAHDLPIEIDRARFNRHLGWHPDGRSFYYARIPEGGRGAKRDANIRLYRHVLGREAVHDEIVFASGVGGARDVPEFVHPSIYIPYESKHAYAIVREGVRNEVAVHVTDLRDLDAGKPHWRKLAGVEDQVLAVTGEKDDLYLLSHHGAQRRRVLRVKATAPDLRAAKVVIPEGDTVIEDLGLASDALYLRTMVAGVDRLERVRIGLLGTVKAAEYVRTPFDTSIEELVTHPRVPGALLLLQGWIDDPSIVQIDVHGDMHNTGLQPANPADFSGVDAVRLYAPAADGAKIPITLIYKKTTTLTRENPTLLEGYGSYGLSMRPRFDATRLAWIERGGIYAVAHVRGGGEYGEAWHEAGRGAAKVNTIDDIIAVSDFIVKYGFTNPKRLAILGTSAGGIPAGGALVRRPELYAALVARVPVLDMMRYETMASGGANVPEFGSAATAEGAQRLLAISAYHHVKDGTAYPGVLLTAGMNDPRIPAWQPGKMAARLQQASTSGKPVLLRIDWDSGHGVGTPRRKRDEELADIYSFLLWQMGDPAFQPREAAAAPAAAPSPAAATAPAPAPATEPTTPPAPAPAAAPAVAPPPLPPSRFAPGAPAAEPAKPPS
ncbi:MAG TPA: prolyl oligopeptidase family serine peptidase [Usitatibacter sp.]|nr:prolyl oligopeptidase family serine peptidase [Usitatibacter sp.]